MKDFRSVVVLAVAFSSFAFADIIPQGMKVVGTTLMVKGLDSSSKTSDGRTLVLVVRQIGGRVVVTKVQDSTKIDKGYKFNQASLFFVSEDLLNAAGGDVRNIDYSRNQAGLTKGNIPDSDFSSIVVEKASPLQSRTVTYQVK